ncbi:hypothetical protein ACFX1R_046694 [Malus domestica]
MQVQAPSLDRIHHIQVNDLLRVSHQSFEVECFLASALSNCYRTNSDNGETSNSRCLEIFHQKVGLHSNQVILKIPYH